MKILGFFCIIWLSVVSASALAQDAVPVSTGWVNDFAGVISWEDTEVISKMIAQLKEKTGVEIAVATFKTIQPYDEAEFSRMIFDSWKIGKKKKDDGILILLVVDDRLWRISTGYGMEGVLPDGLCGQIGRSHMLPY